jgi:hypothetical protein
VSDSERVEKIERWLVTALLVDLSQYGPAVSLSERIDRVERAVGHCLGFSVGGGNGVE